MPTSTNPAKTESFSQHIGTSPAGVEWIARNPEHVATMTARLAKLWDRHNKRNGGERRQALSKLRGHIRLNVSGAAGRLTFRSRYQGSIGIVEELVAALGGTVIAKGKSGKVKYLPGHQTTLPYYLTFTTGNTDEDCFLRLGFSKGKA